jgi:hypothetical protein
VSCEVRSTLAPVAGPISGSKLQLSAWILVPFHILYQAAPMRTHASILDYHRNCGTPSLISRGRPCLSDGANGFMGSDQRKLVLSEHPLAA